MTFYLTPSHNNYRQQCVYLIHTTKINPPQINSVDRSTGTTMMIKINVTIKDFEAMQENSQRRSSIQRQYNLGTSDLTTSKNLYLEKTYTFDPCLTTSPCVRDSIRSSTVSIIAGTGPPTSPAQTFRR